MAYNGNTLLNRQKEATRREHYCQVRIGNFLLVTWSNTSEDQLSEFYLDQKISDNLTLKPKS